MILVNCSCLCCFLTKICDFHKLINSLRLKWLTSTKVRKRVEVGRILFIYRKNSTKKDKENKTKQRKTMYSEQLYTITILTLNKSIQAVQLIY